MDEVQIREAALRLAIESIGFTGLIRHEGDGWLEKMERQVMERAEKFEAYLRGPYVVDGPDGDEPPLMLKTWKDKLGL